MKTTQKISWTQLGFFAMSLAPSLSWAAAAAPPPSPPPPGGGAPVDPNWLSAPYDHPQGNKEITAAAAGEVVKLSNLENLESARVCNQELTAAQESGDSDKITQAKKNLEQAEDLYLKPFREAVTTATKTFRALHVAETPTDPTVEQAHKANHTTAAFHMIVANYALMNANQMMKEPPTS